MTAAQMQLAWEDSMAKSTAMTTALVAVASASSVATSPNTAADNIQAQSSHAVAYAAAAVQATPVSEVSMNKRLSCCDTEKVLHHTEKLLHHTDKVLHHTGKGLHGSWWEDRLSYLLLESSQSVCTKCTSVIQTAGAATCCWQD